MKKIIFTTALLFSTYSLAQSASEATCNINISGYYFQDVAATESEALEKTQNMCIEVFGYEPCVLAVPECSQTVKAAPVKQKRQPIEQMSNAAMEESRKGILAQLKDQTLGDTFSFQMQLAKGSVNRQIKKTLIDAYIDETLIKSTRNSESEIQEAVNLLCYNANGCATKKGEKKLAKIKDIVTDLLSNKNMSLIILDSNGMGTFGVAQGLAVHDAETNQVFVVMSGYAE